MTQSFMLSPGQQIMYEGEVWSVQALVGQTVQLTRPTAAPVVLRVADLVAAPGFRHAHDTAAELPALGPVFTGMNRAEYEALLEREAHVLEVTTGYRRGSRELALLGEPQSAYLPGAPQMMRYEAKARELGVSVPTVRRMVKRYGAEGVAGLVDGHKHRPQSPTGRVDSRWITVLKTVIAEHVDASQPSRRLVIDRTNARVRAVYGKEVSLPGHSTASRVLKEVTKGQQAFGGTSAKQKRSIAGRPMTPYGRLRAQRVGEYVLLDTSPLDVFAMDPITLRWVGVQLTIAMDLATRSVIGLRLSPISANSVDAALVLYEAISPGSRSHTSSGLLPYGGIPATVFFDGETDEACPGLPGTTIETIVIDHGKMYMSLHLRSVCERLGISIQPARVLTSTDKAPVERFFRTIREDLLAALHGYKGPDAYSRGKNVEDFAYYFSHELEEIIREWVVKRYHERPHDGLCESQVPGLSFTPNKMWEDLTTSAGHVLVPRRADLVYDFLPVAWRTIQHYGVEVNGLRYDGAALEGLRGTSSPYANSGGKWPIRFDPDDAGRVFFQRPDDLSWSELRWEHARDIPVPFSTETLRYARRLARAEARQPDDRQALIELLERWDAGLVNHPTERRLALRLSEQRAARLASNPSADSPATGEATSENVPADLVLLPPLTADDDDSGDLDDFYGDALEVGQ